MAKRKHIIADCLTWNKVLAFLDTLPPWQSLCDDVTSRCATFTEATRRLMAVAVGVCAHNYDFPQSLHRLLRMVNDGEAKPFRWHGHVDPKRWLAINTVIIAIQGWLQEASIVSLSRQYSVTQKHLKTLTNCMGAERSHIKRAMLRRLLWNLIDNAVHNTGLGIIGDCEEIPPAELKYLDFTEAYRFDEDRYYYELRPEDRPIRELDEEIESFGQSGVSFLSYVKMPTPPFCQQKMLRYQQIALHRIAGKWTDPTARPPGGVPRSHYETLFDTYSNAISRWYEDLGPARATDSPEVYETVFKLLGARTECKRAVVDCLIFRSKSAQDLQEAAFYWLKENTQKAV